jgi:hypothetical protein
MSESENHGIIGNVSAQNVAVGRNARIDVRGEAQLSEQLAALLHAIESFSGDPQARADLAVAAGEVAEELDRPVPDKERALSWLSRIASAAGSASAIAGAATAMASAVRALL